MHRALPRAARPAQIKSSNVRSWRALLALIAQVAKFKCLRFCRRHVPSSARHQLPKPRES
eukprot:scaffold273_cov242-Pinguiococcus_pyrenoidosus.AAC.13